MSRVSVCVSPYETVCVRVYTCIWCVRARARAIHTGRWRFLNDDARVFLSADERKEEKDRNEKKIAGQTRGGSRCESALFVRSLSKFGEILMKSTAPSNNDSRSADRQFEFLWIICCMKNRWVDSSLSKVRFSAMFLREGNYGVTLDTREIVRSIVRRRKEGKKNREREREERAEKIGSASME